MSGLQAIPESTEPQLAAQEDPARVAALNRSLALNRFQLRIAGLGLILCLGATVAEGVKSLEGPSNPEPQYAEPGPCSPPSAGAVKAVAALFGKNNQGSVGTIAAAQESGVHLNLNISNDFNAPYSQPGTTNDTTTTPQASITWANYDLQPFGVTIQDGVPGGKDDGLSNPTKADLDENVNPALDEITQPLTFLPIELIQLTGLKKIILMANPNSNLSFEWDNLHTLVWNIDNPPYPEETTEALYQGIDTTECYFSGGDPDYTDLSGGGVVNIYGPHGQHQGMFALSQFSTTPPQDPENYSVDIEDALTDPYNNNNVYSSTVTAAYQRGAQTGDYTEFCALVNHYLENIVVADQEDFQSPYEDKSDLGGLLLDVSNDNYEALLDPHSPVIRRKALFLLGRLYDADPNVVKYLAYANGGYYNYGEECP